MVLGINTFHEQLRMQGQPIILYTYLIFWAAYNFVYVLDILLVFLELGYMLGSTMSTE
jgi:hypothetical protein